jgi:competence protein ComEC
MGGLLIISAFFIAGNLRLSTSSPDENKALPEFSEKTIFLVNIREAPVLGRSSCRFTANCLGIWESGKLHPFYTLINITVAGLKPESVPAYGKRILVSGRPSLLVNPASSPVINSFHTYLFKKGIRYTMIIRDKDITELKNQGQTTVRALANSIRDALLKNLRRQGLENQEFALAAALLLGYTSDIEGKLKSSFAASGTMHVLSVSGMHVGTIFLFLEWLLAFTSGVSRGRLLKSSLQITGIWIYAAITGFSPAVMRASLCLSLICIGRNLKRKPEMLNVVCASLLILLATDPSLLFDLGFQLSYLAVCGIVIMYPPIYHLFAVRNRFTDKMWSLAALSVAAQIATFPLSLYYFHRFPNYFFISNLVAVPLSNAIIIAGIGLLAFAGIPVLGFIFSQSVHYMLKGLILVISWLASLPGAVSSGFYPSVAEVIIWYFMVLTVLFLLVARSRQALIFILSGILLLTLASFSRKYYRLYNSSIAVHASSAGYLIRYSRGGNEICYFSGLRMASDQTLKKLVDDDRARNGTVRVLSRWSHSTDWQTIAGFSDAGRFGRFMQLGDQRICLIEKPLPEVFRGRLHCDIVIICCRERIRFSRLKVIFSPDIVLNAAHASRYRSALLSDSARKSGLEFYDLRSTGYYREEF